MRGGRNTWLQSSATSSWLLQQYASGKPHGSPSLLSSNLLFYSEGKYSVGTNGVLRKLKHIFPNTYQRINMMARLPPR